MAAKAGISQLSTHTHRTHKWRSLRNGIDQEKLNDYQLVGFPKKLY